MCNNKMRNRNNSYTQNYRVIDLLYRCLYLVLRRMRFSVYLCIHGNNFCKLQLTFSAVSPRHLIVRSYV